jgi:transketolase
MSKSQTVEKLKDIAYQARVDLIKLCGTYGDPVHIGGDLSMTDMLVALYHYGMNVDPKNISMPERDRFILSKGHGAVCMYIIMALRGFFDYDEIVRTYGKLDSAFGQHPCRTHLPALEASTGSLGQGFPIAVGLALYARRNREKYRVFCMMGDGETCEGSVWEAAMCASSYKLGNLVAVIDRNKQFMTSFCGDFINQDPYADKWRAFGWNVIEIDGHDMAAIVDAIDSLPAPDSEKPTVIIGNTIKGKGVSFMEGNIGWHAGVISREDMGKALNELAEARKRGDM